MLKKVILAAAGLAAGLALSAPVFADGYGYRDYRHAPRVAYQPVYVVQRPVVVRQVYHRAPAVYPAYYQSSSPGAGAAIFFGAVLGAVVAHQIVTH